MLIKACGEEGSLRAQPCLSCGGDGRASSEEVAAVHSAGMRPAPAPGQPVTRSQLQTHGGDPGSEDGPACRHGACPASC